MAEALSRSEVESLLSALNPHQISVVRDAVEPDSAAGRPVNSSQLARRVVGLFERFRHAMTSATDRMITEPARLKRHMPVRIPFSELRERMLTGQVLLLVESEQSGGDLLVVLAFETANRLVNCMLGQGGETARQPDGSSAESLSPLEERLLLRWLKESFHDVAEPLRWRPVAFEFLDAARDLDAYFAQAPWWCETWELKAEQLRGRIQIAGQWEFFSSLPSEEPVAEEPPTGLDPADHQPDIADDRSAGPNREPDPSSDL